jgi:Tfp pilus assembly protein PilF
MYRNSRFAQPQDAGRIPIIVTIAVVSLLAIGITFAKKDGKVSVVAAEPATALDTPTTVSAGDVVQVPERHIPTFASANAAYTQRKYGEAVEEFEGYVLRHPDNAFGHYMLGLSAWKGGDLKRARQALERSLEIDSTSVKTLLNLGRVLLDEGKATEAEPPIRAALALDPESGEVHRMLGRVQSALGQVDSAEASYLAALSIEPKDSWSMNNLGLLLIEQGRYEDAVMPLARAVELRPDAPAFANNLGLALERTGHPGSAAMAYRSALAADSTYAKAALSLARVEGMNDETPIDVAQLATEFSDSLQSAARLRVAAKIVVRPQP